MFLFYFQTSKYSVQLVEIVKRPGQTLGLYIREGNGADRQEGVFISRIALESPVYNSGCLRVGDEVLAVNLVDVTRMSLDDVVIIMSIPRRLLLTTRSRRGVRQPQHQPNRHEPKPPPVVVLKKDYEEEPLDDSNSNGDQLRLGALGRPPYPHGMPPPQERFSTLPRYRPPDMSALRHEEPLMYPNRGGPQGPPPLPPHYGMKTGPHPGPPMGMGPPHATHPGYGGRGGRMPGPGGSRGGYGMPQGADYLYQPPPPVITEQPRQRHPPPFYQYDRSYPKTLESLAERIHSFYGPPRPPGPHSLEPDIGYGGTLGRSTAGRPRLARTLSDQRLPATEREALSDYEGSSGVSAARRYKAWQQANLAPLQQAYGSEDGAALDRYQEAMRRLSALRQRTRSVDYSSDTELLAPRPFAARPRSSSSRSNSLPRQRPYQGGGIGSADPLSRQRLGRGVRSSLGPGMRLSASGRHSLAGSEDESDGAVSAPEMASGPRHDRGKHRSSTTASSSTKRSDRSSLPLSTNNIPANYARVNDISSGVGNGNGLGKDKNMGHLMLDTNTPKDSTTFSNELKLETPDNIIQQQQTDLQYHLEQKRLLKQKLKQQKRQILLEKHMQQQQQYQEYYMTEDLLTQQLDQHIQQHERIKKKESRRKVKFNKAEATEPRETSEKPDLLTQQLDQHISQQQAVHGVNMLGSESDSSFQAGVEGYNDDSDSDFNTSTTEEEGPVNPRAVPQSNNNSTDSMMDEEGVPLILKQHTLSQNKQNHRRSKSDVIFRKLSTTQRVPIIPYINQINNATHGNYSRVTTNVTTALPNTVQYTHTRQMSHSNAPNPETLTQKFPVSILKTPRVVVHPPNEPLLPQNIPHIPSRSSVSSTFNNSTTSLAQLRNSSASPHAFQPTAPESLYFSESRTLPRNLPSRIHNVCSASAYSMQNSAVYATGNRTRTELSNSYVSNTVVYSEHIYPTFSTTLNNSNTEHPTMQPANNPLNSPSHKTEPSYNKSSSPLPLKMSAKTAETSSTTASLLPTSSCAPSVSTASSPNASTSSYDESASSPNASTSNIDSASSSSNALLYDIMLPVFDC